MEDSGHFLGVHIVKPGARTERGAIPVGATGQDGIDKLPFFGGRTIGQADGTSSFVEAARPGLLYVSTSIDKLPRSAIESEVEAVAISQCDDFSGLPGHGSFGENWRLG